MPATVASRQVRRYCSALVAVVIALLGAGIAGSASSADPGAAARLVRPVSRPARECDNVRRWRLHSATIWRWRKGIGNVAGNFSFTQTGGACQCGTRGTIWRQRTGSGTGEGTPPRSPPAEFELYKRNEAPSAGIVVESSSWPGEQSHFFYRVQTQLFIERPIASVTRPSPRGNALTDLAGALRLAGQPDNLLKF